MTELVVDDEVKDEQEVEVSVGSIDSYDSPWGDTGNDPFNKKAEALRTLEGTSPAFKRRVTRELQKYQRGIDGAETKQLNPTYSAGTGYSHFDVAIPPYNLEYLAKIYEKNETNFAAINAKVANIVGLGFDWKESPTTQELLDKIDDPDKLNKARRKLTKARNALNEWVETLNQEDTFLETLMKVYTDIEATGNGYLEIGRTTAGRVGYIGHIPSSTLRVRIARDGFVQLIGDKAKFFRNFGDRTTTDKVGNDRRPNEIIHFKKYTPTDSYYGIPDIIAAQNALAGSEYASRYNLDYFEHKAVPRYVIVIKGAKLSPTAERNTINFFRGGLKGKNHRTLYVPLPAGTTDKPVEFEMKPVEVGKQDQSFGDYDSANRDKILMAHRVPITKVSAVTGAALAAAKDADKTFKETVCRPAQDVFETKINKVIKEVTDAFVFALNELTLTDETEQSKIDQVYLTTGVLVPNEVRARMGRPGLKGGDKIIAAAQAKPTATGGAKPATGRSPDQRTTSRGVNSPDRGGQGRAPKGEGRQQA